MAEFTGFAGGVSVNRIITKKVIHDLIRDSEFIQIVRSGVYFVLGHCAEEIERACEASSQRKQIRIVLPSIFNKDVIVRACEAGRSPDEVLAKLGEWHETLAKLGEKLAPHHSLELRTTMEPHRYHAIFSESHAIIGVPWHRRASLTTSSFFVGPDASSVISNLHEDFDVFYEKCTVYKPGDNDRNRAKTTPRVIDDPVLQGFGRTLPWILAVAMYVASAFPDANGNGVTKDHVHDKFHTDKSDCNKRLVEMEDAGLLKRAGTPQDRRHGRLATAYGKMVAVKYRQHRLDIAR